MMRYDGQNKYKIYIVLKIQKENKRNKSTHNIQLQDLNLAL